MVLLALHIIDAALWLLLLDHLCHIKLMGVEKWDMFVIGQALQKGHGPKFCLVCETLNPSTKGFQVYI